MYHLQGNLYLIFKDLAHNFFGPLAKDQGHHRMGRNARRREVLSARKVGRVRLQREAISSHLVSCCARHS